MLELFSYWRSSAAFRVRIALNLKGVDYRISPVNIAPAAAEHLGEAYLARNPEGRVPALATDQGVLSQSPAILDWLEARFPEPALLPADPWARAQVLSFANVIACDIHPLNNVSVLGALKRDFGADDEAVGRWYRGWIARGFAALEAKLAGRAGTAFAFSDAPGLAEVYLVPQMWNARRFETDLSPYPRLVAIDAAARALPAFRAAAPEAQPDRP